MSGSIAQRGRRRSRHEEVEALLRAFAERDLGAVRALAEAGCDLDAASAGLTVLMRAVLRRDAVAVEWILSAGADAQVRGGDGRTALDHARGLGSSELVELLVLAGAAEAEEPASPPVPPVRPPRSAVGRRRFDDRIDDRFDDRFDDALGSG